MSPTKREGRALQHVARRAEAHGKEVTVCGEAAGDPLAACLLIGLGFQRLSMSPARAARVRAAVRLHSRSALADVATHAVEARTRSQVVGIHDRGRSPGSIASSYMGSTWGAAG